MGRCHRRNLGCLLGLAGAKGKATARRAVVDWSGALGWLRSALELRTFVVDFALLHSKPSQHRYFALGSTLWTQHGDSSNRGGEWVARRSLAQLPAIAPRPDCGTSLQKLSDRSVSRRSHS